MQTTAIGCCEIFTAALMHINMLYFQGNNLINLTRIGREFKKISKTIHELDAVKTALSSLLQQHTVPRLGLSLPSVAVRPL